MVGAGDGYHVEILVIQGLAEVLHARRARVAGLLDVPAVGLEQPAVGVDQVGNFDPFLT